MSYKKKLHINKLFRILNISNREELRKVASSLGSTVKELEFYNNNMILPQGNLLANILQLMNCTELELKIRLGIIDNNLIDWLSDNPEFILKNFQMNNVNEQKKDVDRILEEYNIGSGILYRGDCIDVMRKMNSESVDLIFADPPFNLGKQYRSEIDDYISEEEYIKWTEQWLLECVRLLAPGGALFVYNLPYWNTYTANILNNYLNFRHLIGISMKGLMPVQKKLSPEHYSLLYYIKGENPRVFNKQRIPIETCRHCGGEIRDYGGKKKDLDPKGILISDIFMDINPVRHKKYKSREENELPLKLLYRIISLASKEGDVIFDPFGGSGTTYVVAEYLQRKWIGVEIGSLDDIIERFNNPDKDEHLLESIHRKSNVLFTEEQIKLREKNGFWGYEKLNKKNS